MARVEFRYARSSTSHDALTWTVLVHPRLYGHARLLSYDSSLPGRLGCQSFVWLDRAVVVADGMCGQGAHAWAERAYVGRPLTYGQSFHAAGLPPHRRSSAGLPHTGAHAAGLPHTGAHAASDVLRGPLPLSHRASRGAAASAMQFSGLRLGWAPPISDRPPGKVALLLHVLLYTSLPF